MSVEESRRDVRDDVAQHIEDELWDSGTWLEQRLDRLILEVRAEMDCYHPSLTTTCIEIQRRQPDYGFCPSCSARAELQKVAEAV